MRFFLSPRMQYSSFRVAPSVAVDGNLTLGENIADQGGLRIAEIAYEKWLEVRHTLTYSSCIVRRGCVIPPPSARAFHATFPYNT